MEGQATVIAEFAHFSLICGLLLALLQALLPTAHARGMLQLRDAHLAHIALLQLFAVGCSFALLVVSFSESDFSVALVADNSHSIKPLLYKLVGTWGNHEGSMLLWLLVMCLFSCGYALWDKQSPLHFKALTLAIQGLINAALAIFILIASNPFARKFPIPFEGADLNPLLQDIGLAMHPPVLYLGYVGFSITYCLAMAALLTGHMPSSWSRTARPWILLSWSFLTLGIGLGSWWAYRELGWGGWWFWDPVENASLLPWLIATALLHSNMVSEKRGMLKHCTLLLAIMTFSLSVMGTFLVRSGIITSVHSFATDPSRGMFILVYLLILCGGGFWVFARNAQKIQSQGWMHPLSREGGVVVNNIFLICGCMTVLLATIYPLLMELLGAKSISIGAPYFNSIFIPMMVPLVLFAGIASFLPWKRAEMKTLIKRVRPSALLALIVPFTLLPTEYRLSPYGMAWLALGLWLCFSTLHVFVQKIHLFSLPTDEVLWRLKSISSSTRAMLLAHFGCGIFVIAATFSSFLQQEHDAVLKAGESTTFAGFNIHMNALEQTAVENYQSLALRLTVRDALKNEIATLSPESRFFPARRTSTPEADIHYSPLYDLYAVVGDISPEGTAQLKLYYNPFMTWLWVGFALAAFGGMLGIINHKNTSGSEPS